MVEVTIDSDELDSGADELENYGASYAANLDEALSTASEIIRSWLVYFTPKRTGLTAESWEVVAADRDDYYITNSNEPIISYLIEGTAAHDVFPVNAEVLHWEDESGEHFAMHTHPSGIVGTDIEGLALDASDSELEELWDMAEDAADRDGGFE